MRITKTLIKLGGCPSWSESSQGTHSFCWFWHVKAQSDFVWAISLFSTLTKLTRNRHRTKLPNLLHVHFTYIRLSLVLHTAWLVVNLIVIIDAGPYAGGGAWLRKHSPSWAIYFKMMQFFTRNWVYTPSFWHKNQNFLNIRTSSTPSPTPFVKPFNAHPFAQRSTPLTMFCCSIARPWGSG